MRLVIIVSLDVHQHAQCWPQCHTCSCEVSVSSADSESPFVTNLRHSKWPSISRENTSCVNRWLSERLQYIEWIRNEDDVVLHEAIEWFNGLICHCTTSLWLAFELWMRQTSSISFNHDSDVILSSMASQITGISIVCSTVCSSVYKGNSKAPF